MSERCGGHVHIGSDYLTSEKSWENLLELLANSEKILYIISNKQGSIPRKGITHYASPLSLELENLLKEGSQQLETEEDLINLAKLSQRKDREIARRSDRYSGINFLNIGESKNTIEFRLANGTLDENTWIENINLFGGIVKAAEDIALIQSKPEEERTAEEIEKLKNFEELRDKKLKDTEKLEKLLALTIDEEDREIYRGRFKTNSILLGLVPTRNREISKKISRKSIDIKGVGKKVFTGEDEITGSDFQHVSDDIQNRQQRRNNTRDI